MKIILEKKYLHQIKVIFFIILTFTLISSPAFSQTWGLGGTSWDKDTKENTSDDNNSNKHNSWGWGYGSSRYSSKFPKSYKKGTIIVSFGDRRLYYITDVGHAVSYPITNPKENYRWSGEYTIHNKIKNPKWTPRKIIFKMDPTTPKSLTQY